MDGCTRELSSNGTPFHRSTLPQAFSADQREPGSAGFFGRLKQIRAQQRIAALGDPTASIDLA